MGFGSGRGASGSVAFRPRPRARENDELWNVLRVRPGSERVASEWLGDWGFKTFNPTYKKSIRRRRGDKRKWTAYTRAVLPGYLFVEKTDKLWIIARAPRVRGYLMEAWEKPLVVSTAELNCIEGVRRKVEKAHEMKIGETVEIVGGPFDGVRAPVARTRGDSLFLSVEMMGTIREIEVDVAHVRRP